jgi:hypothetical protein
MTYKELLEQLQNLPQERLDDTVTVFDSYTDEYTAIIDTDVANEEFCDVLDQGHFYLIMKA